MPPHDPGSGTSDGEPLSFPDGPRSELDKALADLVERANAVAGTQGRLRDLLRATRELIEDVELPLVLRRIVEAAVHLAGARYGAMGVIAPDGRLEQFIHVGMDEALVDRIGHLPRGEGLLGALIADPTPIRLEHIARDERSAGFPTHHPPMESFLGVPITVRDRVFGNLYLADSASGVFSLEDEQLVVTLATHAGFAIENARLLAETRLRAEWAAAAAELTTRILGAPAEGAAVAIAEAITTVARAAVVCVIRRDLESRALVVVASAGSRDAPPSGWELDAENSVVAPAFGAADAPFVDPPSQTDAALRIVRDDRPGPLLVLPLRSVRGVWGAVTIGRDPDAGRFTEADVDVAADLADRVGVAIELVRARSFEERAMLLEDRGRIARDLHDHVIQDLFGTGLQLQALAGRVTDPTQAERLERAVERIDDAIAQIRSIIFATSPFGGRASTPRHRIMDLAAELSAARPTPIAVRFAGPVDHAVTEEVLPDVMAVARELLTNAVRHAHADSISIRVDGAADRVTVTVLDDGIGLGARTRESGLRNVEHRATSHGGEVVVESRPGSTSIQWSVPLRAPSEQGETTKEPA